MTTQHNDPSYDLARVEVLLHAARQAPHNHIDTTYALRHGVINDRLSPRQRDDWFRVLVDALLALRWRDAAPWVLDDARDRAELAMVTLIVGPLAAQFIAAVMDAIA